MKMPLPRRRVSHLIRLLALLSSVSVGAVVVVSDLASASTPRPPKPEPVAILEPGDAIKQPIEGKVVKKKAPRKSRMSFGRFEGY